MRPSATSMKSPLSARGLSTMPPRVTAELEADARAPVSSRFGPRSGRSWLGRGSGFGQEIAQPPLVLLRETGER
jgi:hypothetical protein